MLLINLLFIISVSSASGLILFMLVNERKRYTVSFVVVNAAILIWSFGYAMEINFGDLATKLMWVKVQYIGILLIPVSWFIFAMRYSSIRWYKNLNRFIKFSLYIIPIITMGFVLTNDSHGLIWPHIYLNTDGIFEVFGAEYGPVWFLNFVYSYILLLVGTIVLVWSAIKSNHQYKWQARILAFAPFLPWMGNALYLSKLSPIPQIDLSPIVYSFASFLILFGISRFQLFSLLPIAYAQLITTLSSPIIIINQNMDVQDANDLGIALIGLSKNQIVGKNLAEIFKFEGLEKLKNRREKISTQIFMRDDFVYELNVMPIHNEDGNFRGNILLFYNITELRNVEHELLESENRLALGLGGANAGLWDLDLIHNKTFKSPTWYTMLGYNPTAPDFEHIHLADIIHPDDADTFQSQYQKLLSGEIESVSHEFRVKNIKGDWQWILSSGKIVEWDTLTNKPIRVAGTHIDISRRKADEEALRIQTERLSSLVEIGKASTQSLSIEGTARNVLEVLMKFTRSERGSIFILDQHKQVTHNILIGSTKEKDTAADVNQIMNEGLAGWVSENLKIAHVNDTDHDPRWTKRKGEQYSAQSAISAPIMHRDDLLGIVTVVHRELNAFSDEDVEMIRGANDQVATAISNAMLHESQQTLANHQTILYNILQTISENLNPELVLATATEKIQEFTDWTYVDILLKDENASEHEPVVLTAKGNIQQNIYLLDDVAISADQGVIGRAYRTAQTQLIPDVNSDPDYVAAIAGVKSELDVPIKRQDEVIGVLCIQSTEAKDFDENDVKLAEAVADAISLSLHNARLFAETQERAEVLMEVDRLKTEFLANMSHEIRTPLNGIIGLTDLFAKTNMDERQAEYIKLVQSSGDLLLATLNDIIDLSKIEAGKIATESIAFDLPTLIENQIKLFVSTAQDKGLVLAYHFAPDVPEIFFSDPNRLSQILNNLIANAIKFTDTGSVVVTIEKVKGLDNAPAMLFKVIDEGIGISPEIADSLFSPFAQGDVSINRRYGGAGLGLSISKRLCELMGGDLWFENNAEKGTTFYVLLPIQPINEPLKTVLDLESNRSPSDLVKSHPLRILLAEDNKVNQFVAIQNLEHLGYQVSVVENGKEALDAVLTTPVDLILMDVQMPEMDGIEATRQIREQLPANAQPRIVAVTAHAMVEDRERCLAAGMNGYLEKPFKPESLVEEILATPNITNQLN